MISAMTLFGSFTLGLLLGGGSLFYIYLRAIKDVDGLREFYRANLTRKRNRELVLEVLQETEFMDLK